MVDDGVINVRPTIPPARVKKVQVVVGKARTVSGPVDRSLASDSKSTTTAQITALGHRSNFRVNLVR